MGFRLKEKIIVVGGYGQVGKVICKDLSKIYPGKVFAAGRNFQKAEQFSVSMGRKVLPLQLDVNEKISDDLLVDVSLVVMCLDQQNTCFVQECVKQQVDYIDVTASYTFISKVQQMSSMESTVVLSVGLTPGITNMLVKHGTQRLDYADSADIYVLLGLGEAHGRAAIEWTIDNLNATYSVMDQGFKKQVESFSDRKAFDFPAGLGRKTAYRFNFSDQHVLPRTLGIPSVSTRLCFDSAMMTHLLAGMKRTGIIRWLQRPLIREKVGDLFEKAHWGSEIYAVKVDVAGRLNGGRVRYQGSISGQKEFYVTGKVAAYVAKNIYSQQHPRGVFHIEELFQPIELFDDLQSLVTFDNRIIDES